MPSVNENAICILIIEGENLILSSVMIPLFYSFEDQITVYKKGL